MEATEITKFPIDSDTPIPFGIKRAEDSNLFAFVARRNVHVIKFNYSYYFDGNFNYALSIVNRPSLFVPSKILDKNSLNIFNEATHSEKLTLLIDPNLMPTELKVNDQMITFISADWSLPFGPDNEHYLMCLTNFGGCEIVAENKIERNWNKVISNVGKYWAQHSKPVGNEKLKTIEAVEEAVNKIRLTACCWSKFPFNDKIQFVTISQSGCIAFQEIIPSNDKSVKPQIIFKHELNIPKVNVIEWIVFKTIKNEIKSFVICGDRLGDITLHQIQINSSGNANGIIKTISLFRENDSVPVNGMNWEFFKQNNQFIITICKGMHFFVFVLSDDGQILATEVYHVGHLTITGT